MTDAAAAGTVVPSSSLDSSGDGTSQHSADTPDGTFGRQGRRNALADVLDENVTKTSPKSLIETLNKIQSIDLEDHDECGKTSQTSCSSSQQQTAT